MVRGRRPEHSIQPRRERREWRRPPRDDGRLLERRGVVTAAVIVAALLLLATLWFTRRVWLLCFAGILLAIFLRSLAGFLCQKLHWNAAASLTAVVLGLLGLGVLAGWLMAEPVARQANELTERLPRAVERVQQYAQQHWPQQWRVPTGGNVASGAREVLSRAAGFFSGTFEAVAGTILVLFLGLYLAAAPHVYVNGITRLFAPRMRSEVRRLMADLGSTLRYWILGQLVSMAVVGTLVGTGLALLGVPLPIALGLLAGLLEFIPFAGPIIAATPAVLLAFTVSPMHAVYVVLLFIAINFIEGHLLIPLVHSYSVSLPPAVTLVSLVLMGSLFGFLGVLLATPLAATALFLVRRVYVERILEGTTQPAFEPG